MGGLERQVAEDADAQFETMVAESFVVFLPNADDLPKRTSTITKPACGPGMRCNLAIASNRRAEAIYSFDMTLLNSPLTKSSLDEVGMV